MHRGFTLVELLVVIVIIAALAGLTAPMVIRQRKKADQTEAVSNARQIGFALIEFETEYGNFPDSATADAVQKATETPLVSGNSANDRFRQLIRGGFTTNEQMFYAKTAYTKKPDGIITDTKALENGEVGFGIIVNADNTGMSAAGNSSRPIVMAPFDVSLSGEKFDYDVFDGKAVVLKLDNSVTSLPILKTNGKVKINGLDLFTKSEDSVWGSTTSPAMAYPKSK